MPGAEEILRLKSVLEDALVGLSSEAMTEAVTHISYANERSKGAGSNERLEYLGDAVIYLGVGYLLYQRWPHEREGELTRMRAHLVSGDTLAVVAEQAGLGQHLRLGRGEEATGGRKRPSILAGALEAVAGAIFAEKGWEAALRLVDDLLVPSDLLLVPLDAKNHAQEVVHRTTGGTLEYRVVNVEGPDHKPWYTVACLVNGEEVSRGTGSSKKEAEENAARTFLELESDVFTQYEDDFSGDVVGG